MKHLTYISLLFLLACSSPAEETPVEQTDSTAATSVEPPAPAPLTADNHGLPVSYHRCGNGNMPLVFVHGWCIDKTFWEAQLEHFCSDYEVITIDLAGHGASGTNRSDWTIENFAGDVVTVLEELDLTNAVLIGHSMGGDVVLEAASRQPDRVLALVGVDNFKQVGLHATMAEKAGVDEYLDGMRANYPDMAITFAKTLLFQPTTDTNVINRVMDKIENSDPGITVDILEYLLDYTRTEEKLLKELPHPLYLLNSDLPPGNYLQMEAMERHHEVLSLGTTSHYPMIEVPERFNQTLEEVLQGLQPAD